jgi:hypothetical protein
MARRLVAVYVLGIVIGSRRRPRVCPCRAAGVPVGRGQPPRVALPDAAPPVGTARLAAL